jgi:hypothetical protein
MCSGRVRGDLLFKESFMSSTGAKGEMTFSRWVLYDRVRKIFKKSAKIFPKTF